MRNIIRVILFTLCIGFTIHLVASPTQEEIKDIVNKATALQKERTYQAYTDVEPDYTRMVQQKKLPDGSIVYRSTTVMPSSVESKRGKQYNKIYTSYNLGNCRACCYCFIAYNH